MDAPREPRDELIERFDAFAYDYRVRCGACDHITQLSAQQYWKLTEEQDEPATCSKCGHDIPLADEAIVLRNPDDAALCEDQLAELAWYHTSTDHDWPSAEFPARYRAQLTRVDNVVPADVVEQGIVKALHVGTYGSAIESMLRRMYEGGAAQRTFYLHRVTLQLHPADIQTDADASQLTLAELAAPGGRVTRYVNTVESPGAPSLWRSMPALSPASRPWPCRGIALAPEPPLYLIEQLAELDAQVAEALTARHVGVDPIRRFSAEAGDVEALLVRWCDSQIDAAWAAAEELLVGAYLTGVGPVVRKRFNDAMDMWRHDLETSGQTVTVEAFHHHFRTHSAVLTRAELIVEGLKTAPRRLVAG